MTYELHREPKSQEDWLQKELYLHLHLLESTICFQHQRLSSFQRRKWEVVYLVCLHKLEFSSFRFYAWPAKDSDAYYNLSAFL